MRLVVVVVVALLLALPAGMVWAQVKGEPVGYDEVKSKLYEPDCFTAKLSSACPVGSSVDDFVDGRISCSSNSESSKDFANVTVVLVSECEVAEPIKEEPVFEVVLS